MLSLILRRATREWLRRYEGRRTPAVRAVFLGDLISRRVILDGIYEGRELEALSREVFPRLDRPATALDIGANIGNHSRYFAAHFDRVVAFEPNPPVAAVLRANVMDRRVEVVEMGLSDRPGELNFSVNQTNLGASRVTADPGGITIKVDTLDRLTGPLGLDNVRFIKMDVERHEEQVLAGAEALLASQRPVIAMEGHYKSCRETGLRVATLLDGLGYRYFYRFAARQGSLFDLRHGSLRDVIPRPLRPSARLTLASIDSVVGRNHKLVVASAETLQ